MGSYFINQECLWVAPACVDQRAPDSSRLPEVLTLSSLKLAVRAASHKVLVVLVIDDRVVYEATFDSPGTGLLRFVTPPHVLQVSGVLTAYVVLCDGEGRVKEIVDSGKVLVLPKDAAAEVRALFAKITHDVQQFFLKVGRPDQVQPQEPQTQQPQQQQQQQPASILRRTLQTLLSLSRPQPGSRSSQGAGSADGPVEPPLAAAGAGSSTCSAGRLQSPSAATLYAYEHFLVPFIRHWAAVLKPRAGLDVLQSGTSSTDTTAVDALAVRLLRFMLDNEMWASSVLLLDKYPTVADQVVRSGLELPSDCCNPVTLERLRRALPQYMALAQPQYMALQPVQQQQQQQQAVQQQQQPVSSASLGCGLTLAGRQAVELQDADVGPMSLSPSSGSGGDDSSFESASAILGRLMAVQQQRSEQEALEQEYLQELEDLQPGERLPHATQGLSRSLRGAASLQLPGACMDALAAAAEQLAAADCHEGEFCMGLQGSASAEADGDAADSAKALEGSFAIAGVEAATVEELAMVPKQRAPRPLCQYLERSSFGEAGSLLSRAVCSLGAGTSVGNSLQQLEQQRWEHSGLLQQQQQQQLLQGGSTLEHGVSVSAVLGPAAAAGAQTQVPAIQAAAAAADETCHVAEVATAAVTEAAAGSVLPVGVCETASGTAHYAEQPAPSTVSSGSDYHSGSSSDYLNGSSSGNCISKQGGILGAAAHWDSCDSSSSKPVRALSTQLSLTQQLAVLLQAAVFGFSDPCVEQSYLVFKNHSATVLDTTALLICAGMLLAATLRSIDFSRDPQCWSKFFLMALYGVCFFFPYGLMQNQRQVFLRHREMLLVIARCLAAFIVMLVALAWVPQPSAWVNVVDNTLAMQLQNGFILPSCQQLRLPAVVAIAAMHLPSDGFMLAMRQPPAAAFLQSLFVQLCSLLTAVVLDAWCRSRFMQRYLGVAGAAPVWMEQRQKPAQHQHTAVPAAAAPAAALRLKGRWGLHGCGNAGCSRHVWI